MAKKTQAVKKEKFTAEAALHLFIHLFGVTLLIALTIYPPLWVSILVVILEVAQMKYFGACVLTVIAHKRGYMRGKTFWAYVPWIMGVKDYKKADKIISLVIKLLIIGILLCRICLHFVR